MAATSASSRIVAPLPPRSADERLHQRVRPAAREDRAARRSSSRGRVPQEVERRPRRPGAHRRVPNASRAEGAAKRLALDGFADEVRDGHRQHPQRLAPLLPPEVPQAVQEREAAGGVREGRRREVRRLGRLDAGQEGAQRADPAVEGDVRLGIARLGPFAELRRRPDRVAPQREAGPVGGRGEGRHLRLDGAEAVRAEPEVTDDVVTETSDAVGRNRRAHTGRDLLRGQRAARPASPLENQRPEPRLRQVRRRDQAVVAGPDHDRVVSLPGHAQAAFLPRSPRRTCSAASRPDAPMIPPPGCVAEPHIQRFRSGVR